MYSLIFLLYAASGGELDPKRLNANIGFGPVGSGTDYVGSNLSSATSVTFANINVVNVNPSTYLGNPNDFFAGPLAVALLSNVTLSPQTFDFSQPDGVAGPGAFTASFVTAAGTATFTTTSFTTDSAPGNLNTLDLLLQGTTSGDGFDTTPSSIIVNFNQVGGPGNAINYSATFNSPPASVPEPSAILGILAVAGAGAFARRKS
ncbi:PEP-CTERM sorting domain-containing protein [Microcystis aeruginosa]|uniref:PEP-CTERM sorting domain-containing protein n=1 Tax=Microcystis aeruginosa TaxID=1126 RepID=UPI001D142CFC|nr:PEP-CTERM sorting domain-containing protein [Microcystis aeruginosa]